ncbi:hypothetical protein BUALT_Bualt01G0194800 [Buddleja alternifolia]|uniref:Fe2OG dioxygenase domain-containing protein n=1 Tax=Buddleja alternifolia TaxID=168488 RepID=A0AAV6Y8F2_9LAMI|nr:hypothetical protein BUALT_Bualt01G0194800 [Buddleja alternifolia]
MFVNRAKREERRFFHKCNVTLTNTISSLPERYVLPLPQRPTLDQKRHCSTTVLPVIDLSFLENPSLRSQVIEQVHVACKEVGAFQVINHGISISFTNNALDAAADFFDLPNEMKMRLASNDIREPVREKMGNYAMAIHGLHEKIMEVVFESLGLRPDYIQKDIEQGSQVMAVNCYPACPEPELALGLPPHSDYGLLTIILQDQQGLEIADKNEKWQSVSVIKEALVVQVGDQMEVLTNGRYKSVVHRAILNLDKKRISIASLHSLAIDKKVTPAPELVDEEDVLSYKEGSFGDFLHFLSENDIVKGRYIETLRIHK